MLSSVVSRLVILVFGTLYPAYASYKAIRSKNLKEYVKWMMYWIVFAFFTCAETFTDVFLSFWFPFYYEVKIILVLWLLSPATKGSSYLYRRFVHPMLARKEQDIDDYITKAREQGYHTVLELGSKGMNYATNVILQTAIKGGGGLVQQIKRSYSLGDLSSDTDGIHPKALPDIPDSEGHGKDSRDGRGRRTRGYSPKRSASGSGRMEMYFPEVDVDVRQHASHSREPSIPLSHIRSSEDVSSGYGSADPLYSSQLPAKGDNLSASREPLVRTASVGSSRSMRPKTTRGGATKRGQSGSEDSAVEDEQFSTNQEDNFLDASPFPNTFSNDFPLEQRLLAIQTAQALNIDPEILLLLQKFRADNAEKLIAMKENVPSKSEEIQINQNEDKTENLSVIQDNSNCNVESREMQSLVSNNSDSVQTHNEAEDVFSDAISDSLLNSAVTHINETASLASINQPEISMIVTTQSVNVTEHLEDIPDNCDARKVQKSNDCTDYSVKIQLNQKLDEITHNDNQLCKTSSTDLSMSVPLDIHKHNNQHAVTDLEVDESVKVESQMTVEKMSKQNSEELKLEVAASPIVGSNSNVEVAFQDEKDIRKDERSGRYHKRQAPTPPSANNSLDDNPEMSVCDSDTKSSLSYTSGKPTESPSAVRARLVFQPGVVRAIGPLKKQVPTEQSDIFVSSSPKTRRKKSSHSKIKSGDSSISKLLLLPSIFPFWQNKNATRQSTSGDQISISSYESDDSSKRSSVSISSASGIDSVEKKMRPLSTASLEDISVLEERLRSTVRRSRSTKEEKSKEKDFKMRDLSHSPVRRK